MMDNKVWLTRNIYILISLPGTTDTFIEKSLHNNLLIIFSLSRKPQIIKVVILKLITKKIIKIFYLLKLFFTKNINKCGKYLILKIQFLRF